MTHLADFIASARFLAGCAVGFVIAWMFFSLCCAAAAGDRDKPFRDG